MLSPPVQEAVLTTLPRGRSGCDEHEVRCMYRRHLALPMADVEAIS